MVLDQTKVSLGHQKQVVCFDIHTVGAHLDLAHALFARNVESIPMLIGNQGGHFQKQRRLADTRIAAQQHQATRHQTTAQDAGKLLQRQR